MGKHKHHRHHDHHRHHHGHHRRHHKHHEYRESKSRDYSEDSCFTEGIYCEYDIKSLDNCEKTNNFKNVFMNLFD